MPPIVILLAATVLFLLWYAARKFFDWLDCPDSVERAVRQRKEQAVQRDIYTQAKDVAFILGQFSSENDSVSHYVHQDSVLEVRLETTEHGMWPVIVTFRGASVFKASYVCLRPDIEAYLPGEWEEHLARLHVRAKDTQSKKEATRSAQERDKTIKNFGL